jgi:phage baseplate assembly protein gpV
MRVCQKEVAGGMRPWCRPNAGEQVFAEDEALGTGSVGGVCGGTMSSVRKARGARMEEGPAGRPCSTNRR